MKEGHPMLLDPNAFDPNLREAVERSLEPYKKNLSPELIDRFREDALVLLAYHPYSAALLQQLRAGEPPVQHSTMKPKDGVAPAPPGSSKRGGGR
jgi:hypothetical protein